MTLKLYNTLTREKEEFSPRNGRVKLYTCGPTVHDYTHIGNLRTFIFQDLLRRWLQHKGYRVEQVMNITDVDEKTLERAKRKKKLSLKDITLKYERAFLEDLETMNVQRAEHYPRATEHVEDMARLARELLEKGYAFRDKDGTVYFDVNSEPQYGVLSGLKLKKKVRRKSRREDLDRPANFALWIPWDGSEEVYWNTELGKGRSGWHSECCAICLKYLGKVDIHSGGVDLIFPHHENSRALAIALTGERLSRLWLHAEHLLIEGEKMSKTLRNYYTLRDMLKEGHSPLALRLVFISEHYRRPLNFTFRKVREMEERGEGLKEWFEELRGAKEGQKDVDLEEDLEGLRRKFTGAMDDDLNSGEALKAYFKFVEEYSERSLSREDASKVLSEMEKLNQVLGIEKWL